MTHYKLDLFETIGLSDNIDIIKIETTREIYDNAIKTLEQNFKDKISPKKIREKFQAKYPIFNKLWNLFSPSTKTTLIICYFIYCLLKGCNPIKIDNVNITLNFNKNDVNQIINSPEFQEIIQNPQNYNFEFPHDKTK